MTAGRPNVPLAEVPLTYRARKRRERSLRRERANARAKTYIDLEAVPDPLLRDAPDRKTRVASAALWIMAAVVLHGLLVLVALVVPGGGDSHGPQAYLEPVLIQVVEPPYVDLPPPVAPPAEAETAEPVRPIPRVIRPPVETKPSPPPDPIDPVPPPVPAPPKEAPRRLVGVSLESTTTGAGDAFATGNTRMGQTLLVAQDPGEIEQPQHTFTPPRRTKVYVPPYPASLRGKRIHGEVGLKVEIDEAGAVAHVSITRPSDHDEFNTLAVDAARRCTYEPARVDGVAVVRSIDITVQFQPND
jgi:TonB family protein